MSYSDWIRDRKYIEEERGFWKRLRLPLLSQEKSSPRETFWIPVPSQDALKGLMEQDPLTPDCLELVGKFVRVYTYDSKKSLQEGYAYFDGLCDDIPLYSMGINVRQCPTSEKQKEALIHEMCHIYYRTQGGIGSLDIEDVIQNETLRFLDKERDYAHEAFKRFLPIAGYSYTYSTNQLPLPFQRVIVIEN